MLNTYRANRKLAIDGTLGSEIQELASDHPTLLDRILSMPKGYMRGYLLWLSWVPMFFYGAMYFLLL